MCASPDYTKKNWKDWFCGCSAWAEWEDGQWVDKLWPCRRHDSGRGRTVVTLGRAGNCPCGVDIDECPVTDCKRDAFEPVTGEAREIQLLLWEDPE
jgi:hypothetical protein